MDTMMAAYLRPRALLAGRDALDGPTPTQDPIKRIRPAAEHPWLRDSNTSMRRKNRSMLNDLSGHRNVRLTNEEIPVANHIPDEPAKRKDLQVCV